MELCRLFFRWAVVIVVVGVVVLVNVGLRVDGVVVVDASLLLEVLAGLRV